MEFSAEQGILPQPGIGKIEFDATTFGWLAVHDSDLSFLSFAKADDFKNRFVSHLSIERTMPAAIQSNVIQN